MHKGHEHSHADEGGCCGGHCGCDHGSENKSGCQCGKDCDSGDDCDCGQDCHSKHDKKNQGDEWEKKAKEYLEGWQRAKADYINYKKEVEARQREMGDFALIATMLKVIPVADNFHEAFKHVPKELDGSVWLKGIEHIRKQLDDILREIGLERVKTLGEKFNPEFHEAVVSEVKEGVKPDFIFEEVKPGYTLRGKTLVAAKVKVAK